MTYSCIDFLKRIFGSSYNLSMIFTPTTAARLTYVNRPNIEREFEKFLLMPGMQMVVYGHSGGGKTTLINNELNKLNNRYITTSCITGTTVDDLIIQAFDLLDPFYTSERKDAWGITINSKLEADYKVIKSAVKSQLEKRGEIRKVRLVSVQLTPKRLAEFLGAAKCKWVIEDFHKVVEKSEKKKLSQMMKVFCDAANTYKDVKIIAIGAVGKAREVIHYDKELSGRVAEIPVPLFDDESLKEIILLGSKFLNIKFDDELTEGIVEYSNKLASVCHQICYDICHQRGITRTCSRRYHFNSEVLIEALKSYVTMQSDTFKKIYDNALKQKREGKYENTKLIFKAIIDLQKEEVTYNEILKKIRKYEPNYPQGNLTYFIKPLTTSKYDEIIRWDSDSNKYSFSNPIFKTYVKINLVIEEQNNKKKHFKFPSFVEENRTQLELMKSLLEIALDSRYEIELSEQLKKEFKKGMTIKQTTEQ